MQDFYVGCTNTEQLSGIHYILTQLAEQMSLYFSSIDLYLMMGKAYRIHGNINLRRQRVLETWKAEEIETRQGRSGGIMCRVSSSYGSL